MFNVFALLLDDALKLATSLTNGAISKTLDILQGSVATHLRYNGTLSDSIIANFRLVLKVK